MSVRSDDLRELARDPDGRRSVDSTDRRDRDRRGGHRGRRSVDRKHDDEARSLAWVGVAASLGATMIAVAAFLRAPVQYAASPECPSDGFNGQVQAHRGLSLLWVAVMCLCALSLAVPTPRRRPMAILMFCGLSLGLLAGALLRVDTWLIGYCFA